METYSHPLSFCRHSDKPPSFFCLLRMTPKPPYIILSLAFLGGTPSFKRREEIQTLKQDLAQLRFPQRYSTQKPEKRSASSAAEPGGGGQERKAPLQREWSEINCCTLLRKPVEKILIRWVGWMGWLVSGFLLKGENKNLLSQNSLLFAFGVIGFSSERSTLSSAFFKH